MNIPDEITKEIESSILEHGACGEIEFVKEIEEGLTEQGSELSFCSTEYFKQDIVGIGGNEALGVVYFPWGGGYLKVPYAL